MQFSITLNQQDLAQGFLYFLLPFVLLFALFAIRRRFRWWRKLGGRTWFPREYIGEDTWFPTRRPRNRIVWIRESELRRECYVGIGKPEIGRHERRHEREIQAAVERRERERREAERHESERQEESAPLRAVS